MAIRTIQITPNSPEFTQYKDQIAAILRHRYLDELGFDPGGKMDELIHHLKSVVVSIDEDADKVVGVAGVIPGHGYDQVKMFALAPSQSKSPLGDLTRNKTIVQQTFRSIFADKVYAELTYDLFRGLSRFVRNVEGLEFYIYPAYVAAYVIPNRKMVVSQDGVTYEKMVHGAGKIAKKILVGSQPELHGHPGFKSFEEASANAKHQGEMIQGSWGDIKVIPFRPEFWKGSSHNELLIRCARFESDCFKLLFT